MKTQPNLLWICTDQQRYDTLGVTHNSFVHTPNIDKLKEDGVCFDHAFSQSPVCTPSRASFMSGRYPRTTNTRQNGQAITDNELLVSKMLREHGYVCGLSGKLHLAPAHPTVVQGSELEKRIDDGFTSFHWSHHPNPDWQENEYIVWLQTQGKEYQISPFEPCPYIERGMPAEFHQTTWCANKAIDFISENKNQPWMFMANIFDPHHPFDAPMEYLERYLKILNQIPGPNYQAGELDNKPIFQKSDHRGAYNNERLYPFDKMSETDHKHIKASYWAMVDLIDTNMGRIIDTLKQTGQYENTIIIFMADHGEMLGDHGIYLKGPYFYEPCLRVPLIMSGPAIKEKNKLKNSLVELVDIAPTMLDLVGIEPYSGFQGKSLNHLLSSSDETHRDDIYSEYYNAMPWHKDPKAFATMLRTKEQKLVVMHGLEVGELYDLNDDPTETNNLWNDPKFKDIKMELLKILSDRMAWTVDPLPFREADY